MSKFFPHLSDPEGFLEEASKYEGAVLFVNRANRGVPFLGYLSLTDDVVRYDLWHGQHLDGVTSRARHLLLASGDSQLITPLTDEEFESLGFKAVRPVAVETFEEAERERRLGRKSLLLAGVTEEQLGRAERILAALEATE